MENIISYATELLSSLGIIAGFLVVVLESIIPALPLSVFVALNVLSFGTLTGFLISWIGTIIGCILSFLLFRFFGNKLENKIKSKKRVNKIKEYLNKISFYNLVILFAIPFTPAFLINIASGLSNMKFKKFVIALVIGKVPMIYFWVFIGASLKESITDPAVIAKIVFMVVAAYLVSKVVNKILNIEKNIE